MQFPDGKSWETLNSLLDELLDLDSAARRQRLAALARERPDLLEPLTRLLEGSGKSDTLDAVLGEALQFLADKTTLPGQRRLGPWKLLSELGHGGMAQVFLAARADGAFEQKAALKLLWPGMADAGVLARFEQERQILATLDDARIAHLIDGGVTNDGRPWLAMEYVEGLPVDDYCDQHRLGIDQRLELFGQITAAVGAAHRRLVVHRDIKPANVMVTAKGGVKLLDFGIAKLLDEEAMAHAAPATRRVDRLMTPEYASPEQLTESPITTASDVYQLGALLFQLLAGEPPHRRKGLSTAEFEARILTREPPRPSTRVRALDGDTAESIARTRGLTRKSLIRRLRGDLDAIVAQAMVPDPESRYESADVLRQDIERMLRALPVRARPARTLYQIGKFLRRHWMGTSATALVALAVLAGFAGTAWQARIAAAEARKAQEIQRFLVDLFEAGHPLGEYGGAITARELVEAGVERIDTEFVDEPEVRAEILGVLGRVFMELEWDYDRAEELLSEALELQRRLRRDDHSDLALALSRYARVASRLGRYEGAERYGREAVDMWRRLEMDSHEDAIYGLEIVARATSRQHGRLSEAEVLFNEALALRRNQTSGNDRLLADLLNSLGILQLRLARHEEAERSLREAVSINRRLYGENHPSAGPPLMNLAVALERQGHYAESEQIWLGLLDLVRSTFGDEHARVANLLHNLGRSRRLQGVPEEGISYLREAVRMRRVVSGQQSSMLAMHLEELALALYAGGKLEDAVATMREALDMYRATLPEVNINRLMGAVSLGRVLCDAGEFEEAEALFSEALETLVSDQRETSIRIAEARLVRALCRLRQTPSEETHELVAARLAELRQSEFADLELEVEAEHALAEFEE